mgnify:CR=1 FL=1
MRASVLTSKGTKKNCFRRREVSYEQKYVKKNNQGESSYEEIFWIFADAAHGGGCFGQGYQDGHPELECGKCENKVKENLRFVKGVKDIQASAETQKITVVYDADKTTVEKIQKSLEKIGYKTRLTTKEEVIKEGCHSNCCDGK